MCLTLCNPMDCIAHQAPLSMRFSQQEYWSGLPSPPPGDLLNPGIESTSPVAPALAGGFFTTSATREVLNCLFLKGHQSCGIRAHFNDLILPSVQFSHSVVSDSLQPHGLQQARLPCLSSTPGACSNSCPLSQWCHPTISSCCPLLLLPSIFPSTRVLSNESVLCIRWPKYWSFSFSISPSKAYSGLISFRIDWFDLFAVQGTLKSLSQPSFEKNNIWGRMLCLVTQSYQTVCNPMDYSPPCFSIHGILQARILEWVAMPSSGGSCQSRDLTQVFRIAWGFFTI